MDTTRFYTPPLRTNRTSWIVSTGVVRALALSVLLAASIVATFVIGEGPSGQIGVGRAAHAAEPPRVEQNADLPTPDRTTWAADDSAQGTPPDRAH